MQNSQEINWWLEAVKIAVPSLIALIVPLITYLWLSKRIEGFKNQLQIETYKFQTKFSLFHQRQAIAIEELYSLLAKTENSLEYYRVFLKYSSLADRVLSKETDDNSETNFVESCNHLRICFNEKRIFFESDIEEMLDNVISSIENAYKFSSISKDLEHGLISSSSTPEEVWQWATELLEVKIPEVKEKLRQKFRQLLSAEISD